MEESLTEVSFIVRVRMPLGVKYNRKCRHSICQGESGNDQRVREMKREILCVGE